MFRCNVTVELRRPVRGADGEIAYTRSSSGALRIERRSRERGGETPALRELTEFLFPPTADVRPGDLVECGGEVFEIGSARICRDLDGAAIACRCRVAE